MKKLLLILSSALLLTSCTIKHVEDDTRYVSVKGEGTVKVDADRVNITLSVITTSPKDPFQASALNAEKMNAVYNSIIELGIPKDNISTQNFVIDRQQNMRNGNWVTGDYECKNTITICTAELNKAGNIVDVALKNGANSLSNFYYSCSNPDIAIKQAETLAVKDCYEKANLIASTSGNKLGKLISITGSREPSPYGKTAMYECVEPASTVLSGGKIEYQMYMYAKYEIK